MLVIGSSIIPAIRKLFGHRSAIMKYYKCKKCNIYSEKYTKTYYEGDHNYEISIAESYRKYV